MWKNRKIGIYLLIIFTFFNINSSGDEKKYLTKTPLIKYFYQPNIPDEIKINLIGKDYIKYLKQIKKVGGKKNLLTTLTNYTEKEWVNGKLTWNKNDSIDIKLKLHGDFNDHISIPYSSLRVTSKKAFLNQTKEFILFKPKTRRYDAEVFGTLLLKKIGILAPYTREISLKINSNKFEDYIFQEKINKYLIERAGLRDGPIIEFDERHKWNYHLLGENANIASASIYKIDNPKYIKNEITEQQVFKAITAKQNISQDINFENRLFESTLSILGACHGLALHNRKYYYDTFNQKFLPIYYDGMFFYKKEENFCEKRRTLDNENFFSKDIEEYLRNFFNNVNFKTELKKDYFYLTKNKDENRFNYFWNYMILNFKKYQVKTNNHNIDFNKTQLVKKIENLEDILNKFQSKYPIVYYYKDTLNNKKVSCVLWPKELLNQRLESNEGKIFYQDKKICRTINNEELKKYLNDKIYFTNKNYNKIKIYPILLGNLTNDIVKNNLNEITIKNIKINSIENKEKIVLEKNTILIIDFADSSSEIENLNFYSNTPGNSAVIFKGTNINIKNIQYFETKLKLPKKSKIGIYNITGCVNFIDSNFKIDNINITGSSCEDGINIINSRGSINIINITNAVSDGIDLDYSNVSINNIYVKNSIGDCIDVSFGQYEIKKVIVEDCEDKGISIGEMSKMKIDNAILISNKIGIAIKDSAKLSLNEISLEQNNITCLALYNKKKEFSGGNMFYNSIPGSCEQNISLDEYSKLLKNN